jgi:hypothetical protein
MIDRWRRQSSFYIFLAIAARHFYGEALTLLQRSGTALNYPARDHISLTAT